MTNTTDAIFHEYYKVRVPSVAVCSDAELELCGMPITEGLNVEENIEVNTTICMLPISRMAEIYNNGFNVQIMDSEDVTRIYDAVSKHLEAWDRHLSNALNKKKAPIDDLILLDEFAQALFDRNKDKIYNETETDEGFGRTVKSLDTVGMAAMPKPRTNIDILEREGMKDRFKSKISIGKIDFSQL